ncbi:MAG: sensor histidine kinase [Candidatus Dormibacteraeota bacterium]|nr:sensor histidine kinase [Candidatus Dormibacteraeota bacterium]MBO0703858.1 sensor histidine kinase [Candidatus Dormibacteraeota bacterium]MBO0760529.1 sensor histidine kinase [Candidatus Dormibacteraeota bacterium]
MHEEERAGDGARASDVLAEVRHETRRPLGLARAYLALVLEEQLGPLTTAQRGRLRDVDDKINQAQTELDQRLRLLNPAELADDPAGVPSLQSLDVLPEVQMAVNRIQTRVDLASGQLELRRSAPGARARADRRLLGRVLDNLLENALLYSNGPPQVTVEVDCDEGARPFVRVTDYGVGMTPEIAGRAFTKGYRGHASGSQSGSGLGLWLSRRAADEMGAHLELEATLPGRGSSFRLDLQPDGSREPEG